MILTLEVTGAKAAALKSDRRKTFHEAGGTIGRSPGKASDSCWILPDPQVSALHASITFVNGVFYIEDRSRNGVFIGSFESRLESGRPRAIKTGDTLIIEPYTIQVTVASGPEAAGPKADDPFSVTSETGNWPRNTPPPVARQPLVPEDVFGGQLDPLEALNDGRRPAPPAAAEGRNASSPLDQHYQPPKPTPGPSLAPPIPDDWDKSVIMRSPPPAVGPGPGASTVPPVNPSAPAPWPENEKVSASPAEAAVRVSVDNVTRAPASVAPVGDTHDVGLAAVLEGAGLKDVVVTPELARNFGQILRVVVGGVMDVLQARQQAKSEFRMSMTMFNPADNNPLKFSADVDDALHNLLVKRNAAYLGPVDAFEDAFDDVRNHQVAMLAGMRVAFEAMLAEFDPDRLQEEFDRQLKKGALVSMPAKLRYWELYRAKFHDMVRDAESVLSRAVRRRVRAGVRGTVEAPQGSRSRRRSVE